MCTHARGRNGGIAALTAWQSFKGVGQFGFAPSQGLWNVRNQIHIPTCNAHHTGVFVRKH
jgi:hypothetical protein